MTSSGAPRPSGLQATVIAFAIRFRGVTTALACLLLGYGIFSLLGARYDVFPEFAPPQVSIQTEAPGLTPEQVEMLVTRPVETGVNGLPGVRRLTSTSIQGLSVVNVFFNPSSDIYRDRQVVAERLTVAAQQLPHGVQTPISTPLTSSTGLVLVIGLTSNSRSPMDLRTVADWAVRPRLLAVPGVADVGVLGGEARSLQIQVRPEQLVRHNLGMNDVLAAAQRATGVRGAGFIDTHNQRIVFQSEGQSLTAAQIARTVLLSQGAASVTLGDVANVVEAPEPPISGATIDGKAGVILNISEQYGANTLEVTRAAEAALRELRPSLTAQGIDLHTDLFRPANFINTALSNIRGSMYVGGALVVIVLALFLFDPRTAAISCTAIPLSLLAGVIVLERLGSTLNTMTLGGLAIAVGVVVDDAVIDVENIVRRLRENRRLASPRPEARVILDAAFEVRSPVVYASFAVLLVFVPILLLPGISGRLFAPLGIAYSLAVLASLLVALTVIPALSMALLAGRKRKSDDPPIVRWTRTRYESVLLAAFKRPRTTIAVAAAFTAIGCATLPLFSASFLPELKEGHFTLHMAAVPGTSIGEMLRTGARVSNALRQVPSVRSVAQRVGRAELGVDTLGTHQSEFEIDLQPGLSGDEMEAAEADIRKALAGFVGVNFSLKTFLSERIEETLSGYTAAAAVNIFGNDLEVLDRKARDVARALNGVPGVTEVAVQSPPGLPQLTIRLRHSALRRWGFDPVEVLDVVRAAYAGDVVGQAYQGSQVFNVLAILDVKDRDSVTKAGELPLRAPDGTYVLLRQVADIYETGGRYQVLHQGAQRVQSVTFNIVGRSTASVVQDAEARIAAQVSLPPGTYITFAGSAQAQARAQTDLVLNSVAAGVGIALLLSIVTRDWRNLLLVLMNLPFALVGGVLAVFGTGGLLTLGSMVGFVTVFGITVRNSILIISHYEHLVAAEGMGWGLETAIKGAGDRLTPILMTSLVTGLALLPLALGSGEPGREIEGPMAVVILGGLLTSMALNLLVLPVLAVRYGRFEPVRDEFAAVAPPPGMPTSIVYGADD
jgi:CzcA family heavy metal efflux pump